MNNKYTDEQNILRESVSKWARSEFESEKLRTMIENEPNAIDDAHWNQISEQGWIGVMVPEDLGGLGLGVTELSLIAEEMGRSLVPGPFLSTAALAAPALAIGGSDAAKNEWLEKIIEGSAVGTLALLEESGQLGATHVSAKAEKSGDGWKLSGKKFFVPDLAAADLIIVAARTGVSPEAVSLFAVNKSASGVTTELNKLTDTTSRSGQLILDGVEVSSDALIGSQDKGWDVVEQILNIYNVCLAGASIAGAEQVFRTTLAYVKERVQFGVPIGSFQAVKHPLADLYAILENARSAYHYAAWSVDASHDDYKQAVATARVTCLEAFRKSTLDCLQACGGIAFTWEYDLHLYLKRAKHNQYLLGMPADYEEIIAVEALGI